MKCLQAIALLLVIVGAINWLLVGVFDFNLVHFIFSWSNIVEKIIYIVVGIAGVICIPMLKTKCCKPAKKDDQ